MKDIPAYLQPFLPQATTLLKQVGEIEFSGSTYQIQFKPTNKRESDVWSFLQLDKKGELADCFCSCENGDYCPHIAASFLTIYHQSERPLHERFAQSLWKALCEIYAERFGDDPKLLESLGKGHYRHSSVGGRLLVDIQAKTELAKKKLLEIIEYRSGPTEENSLKFSNLSVEELALWRQGKPSAELKFELSFWSDLAHWMMRMQEMSEPYQITFDFSSKQLPNQITINFEEVVFQFFLSETYLSKVIPTLATVDSPLVVHVDHLGGVSKIVYDKEKRQLNIESKGTKQDFAEKEGILLNEWTYVPQDGFYARKTSLLVSKAIIEQDEIGDVLTKHFVMLRQYLHGTDLHEELLKLNYELTFDKDWNLHIIPYAFEKGDLTAKYSHFYGSWVYIDGHGFYRIEKGMFKESETVVLKEQISDFVWHERGWLNEQEGFHTHVSGIEAQLTYHVSSDKKLSFSRLSISDTTRVIKDFGAWLYVSGQGFFTKANTTTSLPLNPDLAIKAEQIPLFIRINRSELQLVPHFFSEKNPIRKMQLVVSLEEKQQIKVTPQYEFFSDYIDKQVLFFDDFTFVQGEGFFEITGEFRLPERYRRSFIVSSKEMGKFLLEELAIIKKFPSTIDPRLTSVGEISLVASNVKKEEAGYGLRLQYETDKGSIPLTALSESIKDKQRFFFSDIGFIDLSDRRFDWIRALGKKQIDKRSNRIHLSTVELIRLNALEEIKHSNDPFQEKSAAILQELFEFQIPEKPDISGLNSQLRPYQELGVHWLWFLFTHRLSGLLCDEMGLGKTHQAMALFAAIYNAQKGQTEKTRFLIVCPTSVIYHWQEKLAEFLPHLRVCVFHGASRSMKEFHEQYDVLLTSYGIWRLENNILNPIPFDLAIFDEVQIAKNHLSRVHASLRKVNAKMRLGLTGTPIENQLRELKSLFDLVLPGYMPPEAEYKELFVKPIDRERDDSRRELLSRFVKPFILRRKKIDVLPDLPEKTEEVAHCDLSIDQRLLYHQVILQSRSRLIEQLQDPTTQIPYMHVFSVLSSLKQICDHPAVYLKTPAAYKDYASGKWDLFVELLNEAMESDQKVVIFSQYLHMLDIFEEYLTERRIGFAGIRGATLKRGEEINKFNQDPNCKVFIGSLQAAGLGVDLTAGSVVIHYDRWWNAARENQATDRVHRIGQTRGVQVFKLVTKDSFEERIDILIEKKGRLMEDVVSADDHRFIKSFSRNELIQLLQDVDSEK